MLYNEQAASKVVILHNDSTGGGSDMKFQKMLTALVAALAVLAFAPNALAGGNAIKDTCTTNNCYTVPATPTTTTSTSSTTSVSIHIKKVWKVTEQIRQFEKHRNVVVLVNVRAGGVKSQRGCVNPVDKGWIQVGGYFDNSGRNKPGYYTDTWKQGRTMCNVHRQKVGKTWYMVGWKDNCSNKVRIRISGPKVFKKYIPVIEVRSFREFTKMYEEWYDKKTSSTGSTTTTTTYSCVQGTLVNGNQCQICPPPTCVPTPPQNPQYACVATSGSSSTLSVGQSVTVTTTTTQSGGATLNSINYDWGDGSSTRGGQTASHSYGSAGTYTIIATARFNLPNGGTADATSASCRWQVTVTQPQQPTNRPPTVNIDNPPAHVCVNGQFTFRANYSDPDGDNLHVTWSTNYGTISGNGATATYTAPGAAGTATVTVTVYDGRETRSASASFPVRAEQWPPTTTSC